MENVVIVNRLITSQFSQVSVIQMKFVEIVFSKSNITILLLINDRMLIKCKYVKIILYVNRCIVIMYTQV